MKTLIAASAFAVTAGAASAATCTEGGVMFTLTQDSSDPSIVCGTGNDEGKFGYGTVNGWTLSDSSPADNGGSGFDVILSGSNWSITGADGYNTIAIAFKQSTSYAFFILDMAAPLSGTWAIAGPSQSIQIYSHVNGWTQGTPSEVPLPASAFLLIGGLGGLVAFRKMKKS